MFTSISVIGVMGMRGCGKTHLSRQVQSCYPRVVVIDLLQEYTDGDVVTNFEDFCKKLLETENSSHFRLIYHVDAAHPEFEKEFQEIMFLLYERGSVLIVVEEIQEYSSVHTMPSNLRKVFLLGRHRKLAVIFSTQRPGTLNKSIVSQSHHLFLGRCYEKNDISYLSSFIGTEKAEKLIQLPEREFIHFQPGKLTQLINNDLAIIEKMS